MDKVASVIAYFCKEKIDLFKTKLNKLLFYSDFLCYEKYGHSLTGITYKAIPYGPVPSEYDKMYIKLCDDEKVNIITVSFKDGNYGEQIVINEFVPEEPLSSNEVDILSKIVLKFKNYKTDKIVAASHEEPAWIENKDDKKIISYQKYAFDLAAFSHV